MSDEITKESPLPLEEFDNNDDCDDKSKGEDGSGEHGEYCCDTSDDESHSGNEPSDEDDTGRYSDEDKSDDSMDGTLDKCPICLRVFREQEIGTPDSCEHSFCFKCILEWSENVSTCPIDRKAFHSVLIMDKVKGKVLRVQDIVPRAAQLNVEYDEYSDPCFCEVCGCCDREDRLLLCDDCDMGYHLECLDPPLEVVPTEDWYCPFCAAARIQTNRNNEPGSSTPQVRSSRNRIPRTGLSRRIMIRRRRDMSSSNNSCKRNSQTEELGPGNRERRSVSLSGRGKSRTRRKKRTPKVHRLKNTKRKQRGRKKRSKKQRVAMERRPATSRGRLVQQLGILPPRPGQVYAGLPNCRASFTSKSVSPTSSTAIRTQRHQAGIAPLRMYATVNDLADYFEGSSDDEGGVGVLRPQPIRIGDSRKRVLASANAQQSSSVNVLGPILSRQHILLKDKNMRIQCGDGKLVPSISVNLDKLLFSPINENDSSGYDSFGHRGSSPQFRSHGGGATNTGGGNTSSTSRETNNLGSSTQSSNSGETSSSNATGRVGTSSTIFSPNAPSALGGYNSNETTNTFEDFSAFDENIDRSRKIENSKDKDGDEDDEYNIYSDIEDEPRPLGRLSFDLPLDLSESSPLDGCGGESDTDMVIDEAEAAAGIGPGERESRSSLESIALPPSDFPLGFEEGDVMSRDGSPALPEVEQDSPLSIPLPDSTPPPSVRDIPNPDDEDTHELSFDEMSKEEDEPRREKRDEYDPSHPLTSSEDEEVPLPESNPIPATMTITTTSMDTAVISPPKPKPSVSSMDVSSIPMPPNEEYRRPVIQFSIPSRHRIFSMGSLIRRNKGVMKKETKAGSSISFQSEMSKAFARKGEETGTSGGTESEKVSLVAEIFGSDDDEEESLGARRRELSTLETESLPAATVPIGTPEVQIVDHLPIVESTTEGLEGSKWRKIVEDEPIVITVIPIPLSSVPKPIEDDDVVLIGETLPEVQIIETPPPEPEDVPGEVRQKERGRVPLRNSSPRTKTPDKSVPSHRKESKETKTPSPKKIKRNTNHGIFDSLSESENEFERQRLREKRLMANLKKSDEERKNRRSKSPKKDKEIKRSQKLRVSLSPESNCEEGEILDLPDKKKRKNKKSKKVKKRRRSTKSRSSSSSEVASFIEKKIPEDTRGQLSSEEEQGGKNVCWKKPSKSSKARNYRDGKPKSEEKYFRERDKKLEGKPKSKERSPVPLKSRDDDEDRSRSKKRVSRGKRTHSRHSNRSSSALKAFKSRSKSRQSRSSKTRYERRPRDHSLSPIRRNISPDRFRNRISSYRSRSPLKRPWIRRRSRSQKPKRFRLRSQSISRSRSLSPRSRRKKKEKPAPSLIERSSPKKSKKEVKEKETEECREAEEVKALPESTQTQEKEKAPVGGDKEKRKKRKRREKSISPAKEIFADGDSIVVSLNFQKGKETTSTSVDKELTPSEAKTPDSIEKKQGSRNNSKDGSEGKSKTLKKTILIDLESSPIQEEPIGVSPTLIVLSDDDEGHEKNRNHDSELAVSTTSVGDVGKSPVYRESHGVPADSTQIQVSSNSDVIPKGSEYGHDRNSISESETGNTPARGDALVSSTRDSMDRNGVQDEYMLSPFTPPKDSFSSPNEMSMTPPLPPGSPPPFTPHTPELQQQQNQHPSTTHSIPLVNIPPVSNTSFLARPLGIVNIPGLFTTPTKVGNLTQSTHLTPVVPVVIPPPQQLRLPPPNLFNQSVLATVANALYGPLMVSGPRFGISQQHQQQPQQQPGPTNNSNSNTSRIGTSVIGKKTSGGSVLLPKDQNYGTQRHNEGGESPFSPNSSDGDDLFEPPKDSAHQNSSRTPTGVSSGHRTEKGPADTHGTDSTNAKTKARPPSHIYDSLFGGPSKKASTTTGGSQRKTDKTKSKSGHKSKSKRSGHKKAIVKLSEGELRLTEEVPTSAVELRVKEKFLKKLNRQERVVEEVKVSLKPHYSKKHITKEEYKDILRRAVPKICHNKTGEINPIKIKELVEAYVKKVRKTRKK